MHLHLNWHLKTCLLKKEWAEDDGQYGEEYAEYGYDDMAVTGQGYGESDGGLMLTQSSDGNKGELTCNL